MPAVVPAVMGEVAGAVRAPRPLGSRARISHFEAPSEEIGRFLELCLVGWPNLAKTWQNFAKLELLELWK